jgi:FAD/FMN-containing dehydrogenase
MNSGGGADTAFGGHSATFMLSLDTSWTDPAADDANIAWTRRFWSEMHAYSSGGLYLNFGGFGEEKDELVRAAFGPTYERLVQVKNTYDPTNLFRVNQNIRPTV